MTHKSVTALEELLRSNPHNISDVEALGLCSMLLNRNFDSEDVNQLIEDASTLISEALGMAKDYEESEPAQYAGDE